MYWLLISVIWYKCLVADCKVPLDLSVSIVCFRCPIPQLETTHLCPGATPLSSPQATPHPREPHPIQEDLPSRYVGGRVTLDANTMQYVSGDMFATLHMMKMILKSDCNCSYSPVWMFCNNS